MIAMAAVRVLLFAPGPFSSREVTARTTRCRLQAVECRSAFMPAPGVAARTSYFETYRAAFASKFSLTRRLASNPRLVTNGPRVARWRDCRPYSRWRNGDSLRAGKCGCSRQWAHPASSGRKACGDDWTTVGGTPDDLGRSQPHVRAAPRGGRLLRRLRIGIIGCGWVSRHRHVPAYRRSGKADVVAVFDRRSDRAEALASFARSKPYSGELSARPANESLDAVSICTPPWLHAPQTIEALEADVNVLIEKPMAMTAEDCRKMCDAALRRGADDRRFPQLPIQSRRNGGLSSHRRGTCRTLGIGGRFSNEHPRRRVPEWYEALPASSSLMRPRISRREHRHGRGFGTLFVSELIRPSWFRPSAARRPQSNLYAIVRIPE